MERPARGTVPRLVVGFERGGGSGMKYDNPSDGMCFSFGGCDEWQRSDMLAWYELPVTKTAMFFESSNCLTSGLFSYASDQQHVNGIRFLSPSKSLRSMMIIDDDHSKTFRPSVISRRCPFVRAPARHENVTLDVNETTINGTSIIKWIDDGDSAGGLSSNWSEVLPALSGDA